MVIVIREECHEGRGLHLCCHIVFKASDKKRGVCKAARDPLRTVTNVQLPFLFVHVSRCFVVTNSHGHVPLSLSCHILSLDHVSSAVLCVVVFALCCCGFALFVLHGLS